MSAVAVLSKASPFDALQRWLPKLVLAPSMLIVLVGFYGYILWTFVLSFTNSSFMPSYKWVGLQQYVRLMENDRWWVASKNLAVFGGLFIAISLVIGVFWPYCSTSAFAKRASFAPFTCTRWRCR
jgi:glucose/mannose transport system permease protein